MPIELDIQVIPAQKQYRGSTTAQLASGQKLELKAHNDKPVDMNVPTGKHWTVNVTFYIEETDE